MVGLRQSFQVVANLLQTMIHHTHVYQHGSPESYHKHSSRNPITILNLCRLSASVARTDSSESPFSVERLCRGKGCTATRRLFSSFGYARASSSPYRTHSSLCLLSVCSGKSRKRHKYASQPATDPRRDREKRIRRQREVY